MLHYIQEYITELWFLVLEMAPWLLLGLIFAGLLKVYFPHKHIEKYLGRSDFRSSLNASLIGIPMPLCSCGVIPAGISFFRNGASKGATNSFLISTPQTGVDSILATYSMLGWPFAVLRPVVAFFTGIAGGMLTNFFIRTKTNNKIAPGTELTADMITVERNMEYCNDEGCSIDNNAKVENRHSLVRAADYAFVELLQDIARWLIIGFLFAALISVALPDDFFSSFQGLGFVELIVVLAASVPIYICATGSIPIAAVLLMKGVSPGAALVFLMAGPATNVATMTVLGKTMGRRSLITYLASITGGAVIFGMLVNYLIPSEWILSKVVHLHGDSESHQMVPAWLQWTSAIVLIISIIGGYFYSIISKKRKMESSEGIAIKVTGMTCSHCKATVKRNLEALEGITNVVADHRSETVKITGKDIDLEKVKETIDRLGYKYTEQT